MSFVIEVDGEARIQIPLAAKIKEAEAVLLADFIDEDKAWIVKIEEGKEDQVLCSCPPYGSENSTWCWAGRSQIGA